MSGKAAEEHAFRNRLQGAVARNDDVAQLAGAVTADATTDQTGGLEVQPSRNDGGDDAAADAVAGGVVVVVGAETRGRGRGDPVVEVAVQAERLEMDVALADLCLVGDLADHVRDMIEREVVRGAGRADQVATRCGSRLPFRLPST